jgi:hypothetical protein
VSNLFVDSFDQYTDPTTLYDSVSGAPVISSAYARFPAVGSYPNKGVYLPAGNGTLRKNLPSNASELVAFMSYGGALPSTYYCTFLTFEDTGGIQCSIGVSSTGAIVVYSTSVLLGLTGPGLLGASSKASHGIEVDVVFHSSAGSVKVWLDGAVVLTLTGIKTAWTGNNFANQVSIGYRYGTGAAIYSDYLRVWDMTGATQNAPVGFDCRKLTKLPQQAGDLTQWTANGAASNFQCVDESPPDEDSTYVSSNGNNYDSYGMGSAGFGGVPSMIVARSRVRKDDANTRSIQIGVRSGGHNGLGSAVTLGTSYAFVDACIPTDPNGGGAWTAASADAAQHLKYESA